MSAAELARFTGTVDCRIDGTGPLGLTLAGRDGADPLQVAFVCAPPAAFPRHLEAPVVEQPGPGAYRIVTKQEVLAVAATQVFVHRDVARAFLLAVPPHAAPFGKRLFWRAVLALAASRIGRHVLAALRP